VLPPPERSEGKAGCLQGELGLFQGLVTIPAPVIGGLIWRGLGPMYVFLIPLAVDLLLRIPLLTTIPETLKTDPCGKWVPSLSQVM